MKFDVTYLRSKLGRRIFWLFVVCALLPIGVLALVSLVSVSSELKQQSLKRLSQASRDEGMVLFERLVLLDANLRAVAADIAKTGETSKAISSSLEMQFSSVVLAGEAGTTHVVAGADGARIELSSGERSFVDAGKTLLATRNCGAQSCIYLVLEAEAGKDLLCAEVKPGFLWNEEELPEAAAIAIFDQEDHLLYDSRKSAMPPTPKLIAGRSSGQFEWDDGGEINVAHYWKLPMRARFFADHWTVVASEEKTAALASLGSFRRNFPLVILLAFWVVLFLSLILIRRTLVPLEKLREGTSKVARGELEARVEVASQDEFQDLAGSFNVMAARIQTQVRSLVTLNEIDRAILSSWDLDDIVKALVARLPDLVSYEAVGITVADFQEKENATTYVAGRGGKVRKINAEGAADELSSLAEKTESFVLDAKELFPQYLLPLVGRGMRHFLMAPVLVGGKPAAVLAFGRSTLQEWSQEDRQQAHRVADQMAVALSNAGLVSQLKDMRWGTLTAFARAIDAKSPWTAGHSERVTATAIKLGQEMGLPENEIDILHAGGLLHDVGKIGIPVELLDKPGALTPEERLQIQEHVLIGVRILKPIRSFEDCLPIVREHHERFDGKGYPYGLAGEAITLHGRIFAVADVHDALISDRPYRKGMPHERVMTIMREGAGTQFDSHVVDAFFRVAVREEAARPAGESVEMAEAGGVR